MSAIIALAGECPVGRQVSYILASQGGGGGSGGGGAFKHDQSRQLCCRSSAS